MLFFLKKRYVTSTVFKYAGIQMLACKFVLEKHYEGCYISFIVDCHSLRIVFSSCKIFLAKMSFRNSVP